MLEFFKYALKMVVRLSKILLLIVTVTCFVCNAYGQNSDVCVGDVEVQMNNSSFCFVGGFYDDTSARLVGNANFYFRNDFPVDIFLASESDFSGLNLSVEGRADVNLICDDASLTSLTLNMMNSDIFLNGELGLTSHLSLVSGRLLLEEVSSMSILNTSENAIIFNNVSSNGSYVVGALKRSVLEGGTYFFPVGNADSYHPVVVTDVDSDDLVKITYDSSLEEAWRSVYKLGDFIFPLSGGWRVEDETVGNTYNLGLSVLNDNGDVIEGEVDVFYTEGTLDPLVKPIVDRSLSSFEDYYLLTQEPKEAGLYSLIESDFGLNEKRDDIDLVNTIVINSTAQAYFIIPKLQDYERVSMTVYDSWGRIIFDTKVYANDFNCRNYPSGTYYYHLVVYLSDGAEIVKDDIIEVLREKEN